MALNITLMRNMLYSPLTSELNSLTPECSVSPALKASISMGWTHHLRPAAQRPHWTF